MTGPLSKRFHDAFDASHLTVGELWLRYFALGGEASVLEVDAYLNGAMALPTFQHDMLAHAINERLDEIASTRAPYSDDFLPVEYVEEYPWDGERNEPEV
ncbi:MAG: hypothetical protein QOJ80_2168 [Mycobacterium sp.]|jgi:hypothetical protein|nr:hypothetical protein [Mycobacterium sp.]